ncbi:hypothetical protein Pcac1_g10121 [Phytophthora cactorum]|uniref:Uncharacterized protein n=1 Tax=Phytophthora cactorum TaxID=29920 RepID=A0A8T1D6T5_9STRA|nr:hypothetical protein Pcac1_g10121 [Phytophthora cactorum]KAG2935983.1 hypothetical protein PC117_g12284 [Phytophthora cactorum]KAG3012834.1 hypothetical protein PC120_g13631 [Phytophthora cactorum]KAG3013959.1 hypothetical protein PC119_g12317 [Phytophthora cactorum]KAG3201072.1 hypothetical protein PC128_g4146 [Phytophthora cactorum]
MYDAMRKYHQPANSPPAALTSAVGCIATAALFASFSWDSAHQGSPSTATHQCFCYEAARQPLQAR